MPDLLPDPQILLYVPDLDIAHKQGIDRLYNYDESRKTVQKAFFSEVDFKEFEQGAEKEEYQVETLPLFMHVFCYQAGKVVHSLKLP